ncbi:TIGR03564 family F420-dependent LLM class oxidoreductase [Frankia nepalensis]|uniref:TIGR03564 family F420-dependent LLM class oxidoreductase n=1 Tax=Frankia nepalensis TaxID=1836974 RepID=A0A937REH7_9ACTN|nr:TIGR03564 family F420-dependent LLM class oxidoreductase [Frankia nepalensis]MBL7496029.1 TIGR03564 family F420-dependent LLM class oxidoreductase [Frankia nepalensis]MBL7511850.1 TIGR03564 family F420-dependent LLM class oxidoreductase [Frankia nepalensis]MBL7630633.1 TIGR03564 family F420-dependent LLM class oxidoreductase [Frankia nepalensis]
MRIGTVLPDPGGQDALARVRDALARAADDGLASAWMTNIFGLDALTTLAVVGGQVPGIEVGTAVVPTYPRHPVVLAQQTLTAALATGGRLTLGIGLSHRLVIEDMLGYSFERPARHMAEYLSALLPLLDGQPVDVKGETLRAAAGLTTPRLGRVPVLVAALGPTMLKLAGQRADGTVLWMTGTATIRDHIAPTIRAAAEAAGKPEPRVVAALPLCVTSDAAAAHALASQTFAVYGHLPSYRAMLDREGAAGPADVAIIGDEHACAARIAALGVAGATDFVAVPFAKAGSAEEERTGALLRTLARGA